MELWFNVYFLFLWQVKLSQTQERCGLYSEGLEGV